MLVGLAAAERGGIVRAGVPIAGLDEDKIGAGNVLFARRSIEVAVESCARPVIADGTEIAPRNVSRDRPVGRENRGNRRTFAIAAVLVETI